jgi:mRNA interferase RelE/StbE
VGKYSVLVRLSAAKEIEALPNKKDRQRVVRQIEALADPRPPACRKLCGYDRYRVRQGAWRVVYEIRDAERIAVVAKVEHRDGARRAV